MSSRDDLAPRLALLWRLARPKLPILVGALGLGLLASSMDLASPLVTRWVLDSLSAGTSLLTPILLLVGLLLVGAVVTWWQSVILGTVAEDVVYDVREGMVRRYIRAKVLPLLLRSPGELVTRVTSDSVLLREAASSSIVGLINGVIMLIGTLVMMAILDLPLVLATAGAVAVVVLVFIALMPAIAKAQERAQAALGDLGGVLEGTVRAIKTVKVSGAEDRQLGRLLEHARRSREESIFAVRREALVWTVAFVGIQAAIIIILGVGAWRVSIDEMTVSTLVAFLLYAFGLLGPIMELSGNLTALQAGIAAAGRIAEIDEIEVESEPPRTSATRIPGTGVIAIEGVTARYTPDTAPAVRELDLVLPERGHTAIVGRSGAGKTTVLSLILGFLQPERGRLMLDGVPYEALGAARVRSELAYVEQETPVIPGTIRENVLFANPEASEAEVTEVLRSILLEDMIAALPDGLDTKLSDTNVSGGQRQRLALARSLLSKPRVLLLDEATAQVDGISERAIHDAIRRQATEHAVLTIAHRLSTIVDADTILVMDAGRVVARGTHTELLASSELYARLVEAMAVEGRSA